MVSVICSSSDIRHACFDVLTALGHKVAVFHSPETFVNSGAFYKTSLLILGRTRFCRTKSEAVQWAMTIRPELETLLLHPHCMQLYRLDEICKAESPFKVDDDPTIGLEVFLKALNLGIVSIDIPAEDGSALEIREGLDMRCRWECLRAGGLQPLSHYVF
jgi:hypothetical protein